MGAARRQHEDASDGSIDDEEQPDGVVFSFLARQRIREASMEAHGLVVERLRHATRQGGAATPPGLAAEVVALSRALTNARTAHGPQKHVAMRDVRAIYINIAASAIVLAERADRPAELKRGLKSSTDKYEAPDFSVDAA